MLPTGSPSTRQENVTPRSVVRNVATTGRCRMGKGTDTDTIVGVAGLLLPVPELPGLALAEVVADGVGDALADADGGPTEATAADGVLEDAAVGVVGAVGGEPAVGVGATDSRRGTAGWSARVRDHPQPGRR